MRRYGSLELAQEHVRRVRTAASAFVKVEGEPRRFVADDPKDDYLVALAHTSGASYLVSGDPHLVSSPLSPLAHAGLDGDTVPVHVLTPRQFSELLQEP